MIAWYDMVLHLAWSPSSIPAWSPSCLRCQVQGTTMKKLHVSHNESNLPYLHLHITSHAPLQNKIRRLYLLSFCKFYAAARAFAIRTVSYLRTLNHNISSIIVSMIPSRRPSLALPYPLKFEVWYTHRATFIRYKPYVERETSLA